MTGAATAAPRAILDRHHRGLPLLIPTLPETVAGAPGQRENKPEDRYHAHQCLANKESGHSSISLQVYCRVGSGLRGGSDGRDGGGDGGLGMPVAVMVQVRVGA